MNLTDYIAVNFHGSQRAFASAQGVAPQQVTQWLNKNFIVVNGVLYSPRRELKQE
jgi:DNA-binding transcriptional regulator YdaS (Cro superfamily)